MTTVKRQRIIFKEVSEYTFLKGGGLVGSSESGNFSEHGGPRANAHMIFIPTELYLGLTKKQAALEIGKSAAVLDCLNESLFNEGYITQEDYETLRAQYHRKLIDIVKAKRDARLETPQTLEDLRRKEKLVKVQKTFVMAIEQFETMPLKSKQYLARKAEEVKDLVPEARVFLKKIGVLNEES
jgi:hypothetical protein